MARALAAILVLAGIALGAWALFAANQKTELAAPTTEVAPEATTDTAANEPPAPAGEQKAGGAEQKSAGTEQKTAGTEPKSAAGGGGGAGGSPTEMAKSAEKGSLKSPISDPKSAAEQGHKIFMSAGCNGCHGGTGGGGMGPPLTNSIWVYGSDDDTLFRLIALGSDGLKAQGFNRKGSENVVGPMPPHGQIVKSSENLWKIIAWIRSINPSSGKTAASGDGAAPAAGAETGGAAPGGAAAQSVPADQ